MGELDKALEDIRSIRRQVARSTAFRGYGPATLLTTAVFAMVAAGAQAWLLPDPVHHIDQYLGIWVATALLSVATIAVQMFTRSRRMHSGMSDEMIQMAAEQFLPALAAGALITVVLVRSVPGSVWMLPGLWQLVFSLGVFSSCRFLPRPMLAAGAWYLITALICISLGDSRALSPWAMGIPFGVGQALVAAVLFFAAKEEGYEI